MVAVRMVSEGVDVPRLAVGVYATTISTPLFFAQAVGRFVRSRRRGETASVFLPTIPMLLGFANEMEVERDHVLDKPKKQGEEDPYAEEDKLLAEAERAAGRGHGEEDSCPSRRWSPTRSSTGCSTTAPSSACRPTPAARRSRTTSASPGCWSPTRCRCCCSGGRPGRSRTAASKPDDEADLLELPAERRPVVTHKQLLELRKQLNTMVGAYTHQSGKPHGVIHNELRRVCGGPPSARGDGGPDPRADQEGPGVGHPDALTRPAADRTLRRTGAAAEVL